ncbi:MULTISPECIES: hypothetical protein [Paenibacillus]|uniref:hypothetical protein n=1 Tax=Paenibacillus TaxID=44249 RepID=UPI0015B85399|nr:hypothetical protein [Paenibacillus kribbensis]
MDWLTFFSKIIDSMAWPLSVVLLIFFLRKQLVELLPGLKNLRYKDFELIFERKIEEIDNKIEKAQLPNPESKKPINEVPSEYEEKYKHLNEININSPRAAIIESWLLVEEELNRLSKSYFDDSINRTPLMIIKQLMKKNVVSKELLEIIDQLRQLRNEAVHAPRLNPSVYITKEYINNVFRVVEALKEIK